MQTFFIDQGGFLFNLIFSDCVQAQTICILPDTHTAKTGTNESATTARQKVQRWA
jgi:hypothetical protein